MKIILGSASPRRKELLSAVFEEIRIHPLNVDESYPAEIESIAVAEFLAKKKSQAYTHDLAPGEVLITADTIVVLDDRLLEKPADKTEAFEMLKALSGREHLVITGVAIRSRNNQSWFSETTKVNFKELNDMQIQKYIDRHQPFDKAGGYGIQELIDAEDVDLRFIDSYSGDFDNVVGLPVERLRREMQLGGYISV